MFYRVKEKKEMSANQIQPAEKLKHGADLIARLILHSDLPWVDIAIEIEKLRELCREIDPDHLDFFERIYDSRFARLWKQWRSNC